VSDIGGTFGGEILTLRHYLDVEGRHLLVVAEFLEEANVACTRARGLESYGASWWPAEGQSLSRLETVDVVREMLRERGFCRLEGEANVYIHIGFDYYVFVGGDVPCRRTMKAAAAAGLLIDTDFTSPYQVDPKTGEYG